MSALPIGALAPEYQIAYLVADESALSGTQLGESPIIPPAVQEQQPPKGEETASSIPQILKIASSPTTNNTSSAVGGATPTKHVVAKGDTLSSISNKYNVSISQLSYLNGITNPHLIRPGQTLLLAEEPPKPTVHTVSSGENLSTIADSYGVTVPAIVQINELANINRLKIGQVLNIPPTSLSTIASRSAVSSAGMIWPVLGAISSYFGPRWGTIHSGLDVAAPTGTEIKASRAGRVDSAGWMGGYGNAVIVSHGDGLQTLYGHASKLLVKAGDRVVQGQVIARVGSTGNSTGPHVHFEVRVNSKFMNPLKYLPRQ